MFVILTALVWFMHRANIARLIAGTEPKDREQAMKLGDEPSNWLGLGLLLAIFAAVALWLHWVSLPKLPS